MGRYVRYRKSNSGCHSCGIRAVSLAPIDASSGGLSRAFCDVRTQGSHRLEKTDSWMDGRGMFFDLTLIRLVGWGWGGPVPQTSYGGLRTAGSPPPPRRSRRSNFRLSALAASAFTQSHLPTLPNLPHVSYKPYVKQAMHLSWALVSVSSFENYTLACWHGFCCCCLIEQCR